MDGLLVIDKPAGPTSHDVVARMRRALGESRIGHTGTLDPAATGVLPLLIGRATRLAQFMTASDKSYDAVITLGVVTDTADAQGRIVGDPFRGPFPDRAAIDAALDAFRGTFAQRPPAFSAKKIEGRRSYRLARAARRGAPDHRSSDPDSSPAVATATLPAPVPVTTHAIELAAVDDNRVHVRVDCGAGFYMRSLAHDLGERLGTGAHLASLTRTRSGEFTLADAMPLDEAERDPSLAATRAIPLARLLTTMPSVVLTRDGVRYVVNGRDIGPQSCESPVVSRATGASFVRLLDPAGELVGIAEPGARPGLLHPSVVLV